MRVSDLRTVVSVVSVVFAATLTAMLTTACEGESCVRNSDCMSDRICSTGACIERPMEGGVADGALDGDGSVGLDAHVVADGGLRADAGTSADASALDASFDASFDDASLDDASTDAAAEDASADAMVADASADAG